ncbi:MAG: hypothetical protein H6865_01430 [Rhodospirillales bacterium]|nr:hypothetical protein [Rhodospirillales bacterium]
MRRNLLFTVFLTVFAASLATLAHTARADDASDAMPGPEERFVANLFTKLNEAVVYDQLCNGGKITGAQNGNFYGNVDLIVMRMYLAIFNNHPAESEAQVGALVAEGSGRVKQQVTALIKQKGCNAPEIALCRALRLFDQVDPNIMGATMKNRWRHRALPRARPRPKEQGPKDHAKTIRKNRPR